MRGVNWRGNFTILPGLKQFNKEIHENVINLLINFGYLGKPEIQMNCKTDRTAILGPILRRGIGLGLG